MKSKITLAVTLLSAATGAFAQSDQAYIDKATLAAPNAQLKTAAMVIRWKADYTYDVVRPGANPTALVCYDKSGAPLQPAVSVENPTLSATRAMIVLWMSESSITRRLHWISADGLSTGVATGIEGAFDSC